MSKDDKSRSSSAPSGKSGTVDPANHRAVSVSEADTRGKSSSGQFSLFNNGNGGVGLPEATAAELVLAERPVEEPPRPQGGASGEQKAEKDEEPGKLFSTISYEIEPTQVAETAERGTKTKIDETKGEVKAAKTDETGPPPADSARAGSTLPRAMVSEGDVRKELTPEESGDYDFLVPMPNGDRVLGKKVSTVGVGTAIPVAAPRPVERSVKQIQRGKLTPSKERPVQEVKPVKQPEKTAPSPAPSQKEPDKPAPAPAPAIGQKEPEKPAPAPAIGQKEPEKPAPEPATGGKEPEKPEPSPTASPKEPEKSGWLGRLFRSSQPSPTTEDRDTKIPGMVALPSGTRPIKRNIGDRRMKPAVATRSQSLSSLEENIKTVSVPVASTKRYSIPTTAAVPNEIIRIPPIRTPTIVKSQLPVPVERPITRATYPPSTPTTSTPQSAAHAITSRRAPAASTAKTYEQGPFQITQVQSPICTKSLLPVLVERPVTRATATPSTPTAVTSQPTAQVITQRGAPAPSTAKKQEQAPSQEIRRITAVQASTGPKSQVPVPVERPVIRATAAPSTPTASQPTAAKKVEPSQITQVAAVPKSPVVGSPMAVPAERPVTKAIAAPSTPTASTSQSTAREIITRAAPQATTAKKSEQAPSQERPIATTRATPAAPKVISEGEKEVVLNYTSMTRTEKTSDPRQKEVTYVLAPPRASQEIEEQRQKGVDWMGTLVSKLEAVVDPREKVISSKTKLDELPPKRKDGDRQRAAAICIRDEKADEVLLVSTGMDAVKKRWVIPGGGVEPGEDKVDAAKREILEEAGAKGDIVRKMGVYKDEGRKPTTLYQFRVTEELPDWEDARTKGRERRWFQFAEARRLLASDKHFPLEYLDALRQPSAGSASPVLTSLPAGPETSRTKMEPAVTTEPEETIGVPGTTLMPPTVSGAAGPSMTPWTHTYAGPDMHEFIRQMMHPLPATAIEQTDVTSSGPTVEFVSVGKDGTVNHVEKANRKG